ncbi:hypothetical protein CTheo_6120 [Ceratobasidium theobromae]|uniref:Uncharacterized protein n=1 Tax=Ceratobasidium theobromae TaxID=1582974 RepID=A0A5N5QG27_9AGAM|nr:hypothetical protein CTheo_6120 [Ceratobasidium theobromae]
MAPVTELTMSLDDWVCASARPIRLDILEKSREPGIRHDYSDLSVEEAFPLLIHACMSQFGNLRGLDFGLKESRGPLAYSAALTITGPDEIGIEFPNSGRYPTKLLAKMHAAHRAVQEGAIEYIMQSQDPSTDSNQIPSPTIAASESVAKDPSSSSIKPSVPQDAVQHAKAALKKGKPSQDPMNLINAHLQRVYRNHKIKMPKTSQEWTIWEYGSGLAARLTIRLPSGKSRIYGTIIGNVIYPGQSRKTYASPREAKKEVSTDAVKAGVLEFIKSKSGGVPALASMPAPLPAPASAHAAPVEKDRPNFGAPLPRHGALSNYVAFDPTTARFTASLPRQPANKHQENQLPRRPLSPVAPDLPVPPLPAARASDPVAEQVTASPQPTEPRYQSFGHVNSLHSPVDEVEAVDELLGPVTDSANDSTNHGASDEEGQFGLGRDKRSVTPLGDERSEPMDLESDAGTPARETLIIPDSGRRISPDMDEAQAEEPPLKRQKTESLASPILRVGPNSNAREPRVMYGSSYSNVLSGSVLFDLRLNVRHSILRHAEFCFQTSRAQPQIAYQRHVKDSTKANSIMYHVSIVVGTSRYELSKNYESVQVAEEKLSKRILRQFGIRAKKV